MTQVQLKENVTTYEIECKGHATGSVEVCAAVSILMYAIANWNIRYGSGEALPSTLDDGYAHIKLRKADPGARAIWELAKEAFHLLEGEKTF